MKLNPEEVHVVAAVRSIKGAGKVQVIRSQDGRLSVETKQELKKTFHVEQSPSGQVKVDHLRG